MNTALEKFVIQITENKEFKCPVCGSSRYVTDQGNHELTFHCSSPEARFWDYERGTQEQNCAKQHWDQSMLELFLNMEDVMRFVSENGSSQELNFISDKSGNN